MTHREEAIFLPSNVYKALPDVIKPPVSSMWSKELKRIWPRLLLIGLLPDMNGKGGDRTALTASAICATEDTEEGKKARKLPSILDRSASRWQIKSAPWTPPNRPDRMTFTAIRRTWGENKNPIWYLFLDALNPNNLLYWVRGVWAIFFASEEVASVVEW